MPKIRIIEITWMRTIFENNGLGAGNALKDFSSFFSVSSGIIFSINYLREIFHINLYFDINIIVSLIFELDNIVSRSCPGLKSTLMMPGLEPGTSRLNMLSECAYHLRYIPLTRARTRTLYRGPDLAGLPGLH